PKSDLRKYYTIFLQVRLIAVLLVFIAAAKMHWTKEGAETELADEQEVVEMEEVIHTAQKKTPPPRRDPHVPGEAPKDAVIADQDINLDADFDFSAPSQMEPPPEEPEEDDEEDFFQAVEQMPELIGGLAELQSKIDYPEQAAKAGIEGLVTVQFIV